MTESQLKEIEEEGPQYQDGADFIACIRRLRAISLRLLDNLQECRVRGLTQDQRQLLGEDYRKMKLEIES